jgi:hypothetical protein
VSAYQHRARDTRNYAALCSLESAREPYYRSGLALAAIDSMGGTVLGGLAQSFR